MATKVVRAKAVLDALADTAVTNQLAERVANAFAFTYQRGETLSNEEKAGVIVAKLRAFVRQIVENAEDSQTQAAAVAANKSNLDIGND